MDKKWHIDARTDTQKASDSERGINRYYKFELMNLMLLYRCKFHG